MAINLAALLSVDLVTRYFSAETLAVANRVLALLQAALAMETILAGLGGALGEPLAAGVKQLREMGANVLEPLTSRM